MNENEKNEVMENTEVDYLVPVESYDDEEERSGSGVGIGMLIGSGLTVAAIVVGKKLKGLYDKHKAKKEQNPKVVDAEVVEETQDN